MMTAQDLSVNSRHIRQDLRPQRMSIRLYGQPETEGTVFELLWLYKGHFFHSYILREIPATVLVLGVAHDADPSPCQCHFGAAVFWGRCVTGQGGRGSVSR